MSSCLLKGLEGLRKRRQGKPSKGEELKPVPKEILDNLYRQTMHEINDQYLEGTIRYIQDNHKELDTKIDEVDKQINEIWKKCNQGEAVIEDFKEALDSYESLYLKAIDIFKSKSVNFQEKVSI